ncbi:MAG TPA: TIGR03790 family protein [Verrucomicrobiae bacterium]|nr:TIGR03790 family protein [Verrucomicrobiae bacterium]
MLTHRFRSLPRLGLLLACSGTALKLVAGGSGLNTIVVINRSSPNSCELGNYYCERRQVPAENVLFIDWTGGNTSWTSADFYATLRDPLVSMLATQAISNQIDFVVLSMDIPFTTMNGTDANGTTSALFYDLKSLFGYGWNGLTNSYCASEEIFAQARPASAPGLSVLCTMLTSDSLTSAKALVDQGIDGDGTCPSQPVILAQSSDTARNIRYHQFDRVILDMRVQGDCLVVRTNSDDLSGLTNLMGYETGLANFVAPPGMFAPGAIADSLTSYGGIIFGSNPQTTLLAFIQAGAAGSFGTVTEPYAIPQKFPDPAVYFYQARGFSLAESYYQSLMVPYQGLVVGDPLSAPFRRPGAGTWSGTVSNALLHGTVPLSLQFTAADPAHPLQQVDLFIDGRLFQTLTNVPPLPGNHLSMALNGAAISYTVAPNATLRAIASDLAQSINSPSITNVSGIIAVVHGDRLELDGISTNHPVSPANLHRVGPPGAPGNRSTELARSAAGSAAALTTFIRAPKDVFTQSTARGMKSCMINGPTPFPLGGWIAVLVTKTNGDVVTVGLTNQAATATPFDLSGQLVNAINAIANLQGPDGITAGDLATDTFVSGMFNIYARSAGVEAAGATIRILTSGNVASPSSAVPLKDNLPDLQPRNHIYVTAGATNLAVSFSFDTSQVADGFHELLAVAYEGSHVRTQTRASLPVQIQNSPLSATLTLQDLPVPSPVSGTYHAQVTASTNDVASMGLFSTGGLLASTTNQSSSIFTISGASLGAGLHPFYAVVKTSSGLVYRTQTQWARLTE